MIILVGESGSGKTTIVEDLLWRIPNSHKIVSYTTRPPRSGEEDGVDYHFITDDKFAEMKSAGLFAETGSYRGWHYGSLLADYDEAAIAILTPHGLRQIQRKRNDVFSVYLKVSRRERLIRLLNRGDDIEEAYRCSVSDLGQFDGIQDEVSCVVVGAGATESVVDRLIQQYEKYLSEGRSDESKPTRLFNLQ